VRFEPTPRGDGTAAVPAYTLVPQAVSGPGTNEVVGPNGATTTGPAPPIPFAERGDPNAEPGVGTNIDLSAHHSHARVVLAVLSAAVLLALVLAAPGLIRVLLRRRRLATHDTASAWQEIVDSLTDCGIPVAASESPRGLARRLTGRSVAEAAASQPGSLLGGEAAGALWALAVREEHRRYAPNGVNDTDANAAGQVRVVRHGLRGTRSRIGWLRAMVAPVSVWGRLRTRVPALVADVLDAGDRLIAAVVGRLPRLAGRG
jgi:hypothetical protein